MKKLLLVLTAALSIPLSFFVLPARSADPPRGGSPILLPKVQEGKLRINSVAMVYSPDGNVPDNSVYQLSKEKPLSVENTHTVASRGTGYVLTEARFSGDGAGSTYRGEIDIINSYGGECGNGSDGSSPGGAGSLQPIYQTTVHLPKSTGGDKWNLRINIDGSESIDNQAPKPKNGYQVQVKELSETFNVPRTLSDVAPGIYTVKVTFPSVIRGCRGSAYGTKGNNKLITNITIDSFL